MSPDNGIFRREGYSEDQRRRRLRSQVSEISDIADAIAMTHIGRLFKSDEDGIYLPVNSEDILPLFHYLEFQPKQVFGDICGGDARLSMVASMLGLEAHSFEKSGQRHRVAEILHKEIAERKTLLDGEALSRIHLHEKDFFDADISQIDLFFYASGSGIDTKELEKKLWEDVKEEGAKIIFYGYKKELSNRLPVLIENMPNLSFRGTRLFRIPPRNERRNF